MSRGHQTRLEALLRNQPGGIKGVAVKVVMTDV
jgi:hypothetical protein